VFVGPSGRGKTTAARTLGAHLGYVSDETVAIDEAGRIWPYRKPLSIIEQPGAPKAQRAPLQIGLKPLPEAPLRLAALVLLDRDPDAGDHAVIEPVDLVDALTEFVPQSSYLTTMPTPLQTMATHIAAVGGVRRVRYREAMSILAVLDDLLSSARLPESIEPASILGGPAAGEAAASEPRYRRTATSDALLFTDPDRVALLTTTGQGSGAFRVLGGVGPALWHAADDATLAQLTDAVVAAHGVPADVDAAGAVTAVARELVEAGVLELRQ